MSNDNTRGAAEPVAWMVEWTDHADFFLHKPDAEMVAAGDMAVQSLYRQPQPALTDAELEAIEAARDILREMGDDNGEPFAAEVDAISGLLERLG